MIKRIMFIVLIAILLSSCADSKVIKINGKEELIEPYGWMNESSMKNDSVIYRVNPDNIVWSIIGIETVIAPVILTGLQLYEPVKNKNK